MTQLTTTDAPPIVLELWAYGVPNSGANDPSVIDRAADTITELLEALEELRRVNRMSITGQEAREAWRKANAAIAKAHPTPPGAEGAAS